MISKNHKDLFPGDSSDIDTHVQDIGSTVDTVQRINVSRTEQGEVKEEFNNKVYLSRQGTRLGGEVIADWGEREEGNLVLFVLGWSWVPCFITNRVTGRGPGLK